MFVLGAMHACGWMELLLVHLVSHDQSIEILFPIHFVDSLTRHAHVHVVGIEWNAHPRYSILQLIA